MAAVTKTNKHVEDRKRLLELPRVVETYLPDMKIAMKTEIGKRGSLHIIWNQIYNECLEKHIGENYDSVSSFRKHFRDFVSSAQRHNRMAQSRKDPVDERPELETLIFEMFGDGIQKHATPSSSIDIRRGVKRKHSDNDITLKSLAEKIDRLTGAILESIKEQRRLNARLSVFLDQQGIPDNIQSTSENPFISQPTTPVEFTAALAKYGTTSPLQLSADEVLDVLESSYEDSTRIIYKRSRKFLNIRRR